MGSFSSQFIEIRDDDFRDLMESSDRMLKSATSGIRRYLYRQIDWRDRLICVKGSRGVGKTTLLLQHIREEFGLGSSAALYASLDDIWFAGRRLKDLASYLVSHGFTHLFLDEVHHLPDWSLQIKNVHDQFPELHVVYSGSSLLEIEKADGDLSRRLATYWLDALSFREFLGFEGILNHEAVPLGEILHNHRGISADIVAQIKILPLFERFLKEGAYPFYKDAFAGFHSRLLATVNKVLDVDWPKAEPVSRETILRTKRMLAVLSANAPQQPNMSVLWRELGTERNQGLKMLHALERAKLLLLLAAILKEMSPRAVITHWPLDIHGDHVMASAATLKALFLADVHPEIWFMEEAYQSKRFESDVLLDFTSVANKVWDSLRLYECQYRDGAMERRRRTLSELYGMRSADYASGVLAEGFMRFVPPRQGERSVFDELPCQGHTPGLAFQGARANLP